MYRKSIIVGLKSTNLNKKEKKFLQTEKPWGVILFSRNIKSLEQLKSLTDSIKKCIGDKNYPILIDQEGGSVSRLNKIIDLSYFPQSNFEIFMGKERKNFIKFYKEYIQKVCYLIRNAGININTVPVLDVRRNKGHDVIGNRSFSSNPVTVSKLGNICINLFKKNKIGTIAKHIPGHGMSRSDSHYKLERINASKKELINNDFVPFKKTNPFFAMTAHLIYSKYDPNHTATHSQIVIDQVIRKHIGFKGILISDDISMKALKYNLTTNPYKALKAGCNLVLHCNGKINEMKKLAKIVPAIDKFTQKKTSQFYKFLR